MRVQDGPSAEQSPLLPHPRPCCATWQCSSARWAGASCCWERRPAALHCRRVPGGSWAELPALCARCSPAAPFHCCWRKNRSSGPWGPNLLFLLNRKFRLEGFSLWQTGIVEKNEFWEQHDLFTWCSAGEVLHLCLALPLLWSWVLLELQVVWAGIEILLPECIGL